MDAEENDPPVRDAPPLDYTRPAWSAPASQPWFFEVIKDGVIVDTIDLKRNSDAEFLTLGRVPTCDIPVENPSVSRIHAVLQHRSNGTHFPILS